MPYPNKIANGATKVVVEGEFAARKSDLMQHGGYIREGCETVIVSGAQLPVARLHDRFDCKDSTQGDPHVGGVIQGGASTVFAGNLPVARQFDPGTCLGLDGAGAILDGLGPDGDADAADPSCKDDWVKAAQAAHDMIRPGKGDHRHTNHLINGAYASLFKKNPGFAWMGLGAYASKQVGCAMDRATEVRGGFGRSKVSRVAANHMLGELGRGNRNLFLDVASMHHFYLKHGWERMKECANERTDPLCDPRAPGAKCAETSAPMPAAALDGFYAAHRYEHATTDAEREAWQFENLRAIAYHEQVELLQNEIYNDGANQILLDGNEGRVPVLPDYNPRGVMEMPHGMMGAKPADVVMTSECKDAPGNPRTIPFQDGKREHLHDVDQRMDWIMEDIGGFYVGHMGSPEHHGDLDNLEQRGADKGGKYNWP